MEKVMAKVDVKYVDTNQYEASTMILGQLYYGMGKNEKQALKNLIKELDKKGDEARRLEELLSVRADIVAIKITDLT